MNTDESDRELLLTCDGKGKEAKAAALERILARARGDAVPVLAWFYHGNGLRPPGWIAAQHPSLSQMVNELVPAYLILQRVEAQATPVKNNP